jgi:hypothetical protein
MELRMNYKRIYDQFIADRRAKEHTLTGYTEKHHLVPRSLGGDNSKENLISLSALDHARAHLLLAQVHGGRLWFPIFMILNSRGKGKIPTKKELAIHSIARKKSAFYKTGSGNPSFKQDVITICSEDESMFFTDSRYKLAKKLGLNRSAISSLLSKKTHYITAKKDILSGIKFGLIGWKDRQEKSSARNKNLVTLEHEDGRKVTNIEFLLRKETGIDHSKLNSILNGTRLNSNGWGLPGWKDKKENLKVKFTIVNLITDEVLYGESEYLGQIIGCTRKSELNPMLYGFTQRYKCWTILGRHIKPKKNLQGENNKKSKKVLNLDTNKTYISITEASKSIPKGNIGNAILRNQRAGGYRWAYV